MTFRQRFCGLIALLVLFCSGCAQLTPIEESDTCRTAMGHLSACGAVQIETRGVRCDPEVAAQLLSLDCDEVGKIADMAPFVVSNEFVPKSRQCGSNGFLCWLGFNFACPEPECVPDLSVPMPDEDDPCYAYMQFDDCGLCEYYRCRERTSQCGEDGYLKGYVGRYCDRFATVTEPRVSRKAAQWLRDVRQCLVTELEWDTDGDSSCEEIEQVGIDSHSICYVDNGFCSLGIGDWFAIVHTIDPFDVPFQQIVVTGNACLQRWFGG